jgi:hypothetical protein
MSDSLALAAQAALLVPLIGGGWFRLTVSIAPANPRSLTRSPRSLRGPSCARRS